MTHALSAHAVTPAAADHFVRPAAGVLLGGAVVPFCTLAPWAEPSRVTQAYPAFVGAVAMVTDGTVGLGLRLAFTLALKVDGDLQGVFEAHGLDGEGLAFLFGAAPGPSLYCK